ncbi:hypothetical protein AAFF_G00224520 [Aldrovandia affinis]|uniref:Uncharacterized protein n=1 Tax=Aldrovandia affinis TaxID=143900 RepID=A0AAD7TAX5_9TELE|nr:hypothetical protein AAFF_G00224520 [Aldrovandia affinis]
MALTSRIHKPRVQSDAPGLTRVSCDIEIDTVNRNANATAGTESVFCCLAPCEPAHILIPVRNTPRELLQRSFIG